jgi:hypothetical protein
VRYKLTLLLGTSMIAGLAQNTVLPGKELDLIQLAIQTGDFNGAYHICGAVTSYALDQVTRVPPSGKIAGRANGSTALPGAVDLLVMVDQNRAALAAGDFQGLVDYSVALSSALYKEYQRRLPTPEQVLTQMEQQATNLTELQRFMKLPALAKAALAAGDAGKATSYATELLGDAATHASWSQGDAVHQGNTVLGRVALQQRDVASAKERLLIAGTIKGSPVLNSFGPNMALAKDLLTRGERTVVLQYLAECKQFWKLDRGRIEKWSAEIQGGVVPDFGANLVY